MDVKYIVYNHNQTHTNVHSKKNAPACHKQMLVRTLGGINGKLSLQKLMALYCMDVENALVKDIII